MTSRVRAALAMAIVSGGGVAAQTGITLPKTPPPALILQVSTTQDFSIDIQAGALSPSPASMLTRAALDFTQQNDAPDARGVMPVRLTIQRIALEQSLNGAAVAPRDLNAMVGRTVTASIDRSGLVTNIEIPPDAAAAAGPVRQMIAAAFMPQSFLPDAPLDVGGSVSWTTSAPLPLALPTVSAGASAFPTSWTTTLLGVDDDSGGRVAHVEGRVTSEDGAPFRIGGTSRLDVDLDRGYVRAGTMEWDIATSPGAANASVPAAPLRATMKIVTRASVGSSGN